MSQDKLTVLVLGVGGNVSQGIMKALALSRLPCRIVAACVSPKSMGLYLADAAHVSPLAEDPDFFDWLVEVCRKEGVQAVLSGTEPVLRVLSMRQEELKEKTGAVCIVSDPAPLSIGADKLATYDWLQAKGFPVLPYAPSEDERRLAALVSDNGYPLIAKPRFGRGSEGIVFLGNDDTLRFVSKLENYVVQQQVGDVLSEYTAGSFSDGKGRVLGVIVMHRELTQGTTSWARLGRFPEIRDQVTAIAEALRPRGPCNMQFRVTKEGAYCFEINVRFSGTTPIRARWGFNEVESALRQFVLGEKAQELPMVSEGVVFRYWNELYGREEDFELLRKLGTLEQPRADHVFLEDWGFRAP